MGYDASHHPVDEGLVRERVLPWLAGRGAIDDLEREAIRIEQVRHRAKAWALAAVRLDHALDSQLHVWGRPFLIVGDEAEGVSAAIDEYLAATPATVDAIARRHLARADPSLPGRVPTPNAWLDVAAARSAVMGIPELLRRAMACHATGQDIELPGGDLSDPAVLLSREIPLRVLQFAARFRPGWMDRGRVWATARFEAIGVSCDDLFEPSAALFGELTRFPGLEPFIDSTITENYMVGGWVPAAKVATLRQRLEARREAFARDEDGARDEYLETSHAKLLEATKDAERRGLPFCEATEAYSGPEGVMN
jgi:hypothetical protein